MKSSFRLYMYTRIPLLILPMRKISVAVDTYVHARHRLNVSVPRHWYVEMYPSMGWHLGSCDWVMSGISVPFYNVIPSMTWGHRKTAIEEPRSRLSPGTKSAGASILDFQPLRTARNKCALLTPPCLWQPQWIKTLHLCACVCRTHSSERTDGGKSESFFQF